MIGRFGNLFTYLQTVQVYLMLPFAGIFFAGVLWRRTTTPRGSWPASAPRGSSARSSC
jgi:hypothetical protein